MAVRNTSAAPAAAPREINGAVIEENTFRPIRSAEAGHVGMSAAVRLAPLGDYGGPTRTHALLAGSPAIDAGLAAAGTAVGVARQHRQISRRGVDDLTPFGSLRSKPMTVVADDGMPLAVRNSGEPHAATLAAPCNRRRGGEHADGDGVSAKDRSAVARREVMKRILSDRGVS